MVLRYLTAGFLQIILLLNITNVGYSQDSRNRSPWYQSLNGTWSFKLYESPLDAPKDFYQTSSDDNQLG